MDSQTHMTASPSFGNGCELKLGQWPWTALVFCLLSTVFLKYIHPSVP